MELDVIEVKGVRATGHHGVFDHEKRDGQEFVVDLRLELDLSRAGRTDDLVDTVDYGALAQGVVARVEGEPYDLIERLATVIAQDVLGDLRVDEVAVTVHKPQAPVPVPFGDVAVTVVRRRPAVPVVVAIGANLARGGTSPQETVEDVVEELDGFGVLQVTAASHIFETPPVGGPAGQPTYVNAVVVGTTHDSPNAVLEQLQTLELQYDRVREVRWGPRTLDLDVVQYGDPVFDTDVVSDDPVLTLPHPRAHERGFVLVPWLDADAEAVLRVAGEVVRVADLVRRVDTGGIVRRGPSRPEDER
ncbi:dihydroneopterin aldolase [Phycicoccus sp. BSK3Z-2]|uniref:Bifunctional folate synthesis protein n=1 Tax=Phycicoccus avicenniae TaxID=2828860 RepID=A0A941D747_9MICO|nr:dihydroneopterin aldolase [Phycicoccus avicenniae]MBR7743339.1 dihydroneopterin aldolase [Phycicoccus avicenniae]